MKDLITAIAGIAALTAPITTEAIAFINASASTKQAQSRCGWTETVYNSGEPDNSMYFEGNKNAENGCSADTMRFNGMWNDGPMTASIYQRGIKAYAWQVDDRGGIEETMEDAFFNHMPAYLTNPDHSEVHSKWGF